MDYSVILANPGFQPCPPQLSRVSTSAGTCSCSPIVGSWDGYFEEPTYKNLSNQFWDSRKIKLVCTDVSDVDSYSHSTSSGHSEIFEGPLLSLESEGVSS